MAGLLSPSATNMQALVCICKLESSLYICTRLLLMPVWLLQLTDADATASAVSAGIIAVCEQLIDHSPKLKITLMAVLPRGNREVEAPAVKSLIPNK